MLIDAHMHLFPPEIRAHREHFFDGEPAFRLLYDNPRAPLVGAREALDAMNDQGVQHAVVFGFPWRSIELARRHNDYILEAVAAHPKRMTGFCCLDPAADGAPGEVERCLDAGLRGVGELTSYTAGLGAETRARLAPLMDLCHRRHLPVMLHTNEPVGHAYPGKTADTLADIYALVTRFADNTLILAHMGGGLFFYNLLKREVAEALEKVYFDTAAAPFLYRPAVYRLACDIVGADRILLGTDFPLLTTRRYLADMRRAGLTEAETAAICGGNAARLLGIRPAATGSNPPVPPPGDESAGDVPEAPATR